MLDHVFQGGTPPDALDTFCLKMFFESFLNERLFQHCLEQEWCHDVFEGRMRAVVLERPMFQQAFERGIPLDVLLAFCRMCVFQHLWEPRLFLQCFSRARYLRNLHDCGRVAQCVFYNSHSCDRVVQCVQFNSHDAMLASLSLLFRRGFARCLLQRASFARGHWCFGTSLCVSM